MYRERLRHQWRHMMEWLHNLPRNRNAMRRFGLMLLLLPLLWLTLTYANLLPGSDPKGALGSDPVPALAMTATMADFEAQTGARNAVAAIYLNYRLFDTLFETLLLAISVTGIVYFLEEKGRETNG